MKLEKYASDPELLIARPPASSSDRREARWPTSTCTSTGCGRDTLMQERAEAYGSFATGRGVPYRGMPELTANMRQLTSTSLRLPGREGPPGDPDAQGTIREWVVELLWRTSASRPRRSGRSGSGSTPATSSPRAGTVRDAGPSMNTSARYAGRGHRRVRPGGERARHALQGPAGRGRGLKLYAENDGETSRVWGYRNVWYRFRPAEATSMCRCRSTPFRC